MIWKKARLAEMSSHKMIAFLSTDDRRNKYVIYHTLELQASKHRGVLRYSESRAFSHEELAKLCYTDLDSLEKALAECKKYELIHEEADGTLIFLEEVEIVSNSPSSGAMSDAERSRRYRERKRQKSIEGAIGTSGQYARGATEDDTVTPRDAPAVTQLPREDKNRIRKEEDKDEESTPHNPPQGGEVIDLFSYQNDSSSGDDQWESTNPNTNGSSGFAPPRELNGQYEYPLDKIQKAYDAAHLPQEDREAFCDYVFKSGDLENRQKPINILPAYLKKVHKTWLENGGRHADAPQITREELSEYVSGVNATLKPADRVTPETEEEFWKWLAAKKFKDREHVISKWNVNDLFSYWWQNFRKGGSGNGGISAARKMQEVITRTTCLHSGDYVPKFRN